MYQLKKLKSLLLLLCIAVTAKAQLQLESGKVYNFVNVGKGASMSIKAVGGANVVATDQSNYSQLWYAASEKGGFTLRNLANGYYLQSPNVTSSAWTMVKVKDENCIFTPTSVGDNYAIRVTGNSGDYNYMHADGGGNIVCWESSNTNSQWTMNVVDIDAETLNANWNTLSNIDPSPETAAAYQTALYNLFSDMACTTLKKSFADENAVKNDADYKVLPSTLQEMVLKVYNDSWAEENFDANKSDWDADYAKKYRVQLYEPYNNVNAAAQALGLNAHTNLNNPTGIFANSKEAVYVMVQGTIEDGASLYLTSYTGHGKLGNDHTEGIRLTEGLNIVPSFADGNNYIINYVVETFDVSNGKRGNKARARKLSDYAPLKIHFEGGYINGYYNKVGDALYTPDKNADWEYIEARATQTDVTVLGKYITLQFPLNDDHTEGNKGLKNFFNDQVSVEVCIDEWDNVMLWERLVLGVLDETTTKAEAKTSPYSSKDVFEYTGNDSDGYNSGYGDYYNVHGLSFGVGGDAYMYGGWDHCGYHYNTMGSILTNLPYNAGSHWGPGHEIGHQHQSLLTVNGLTEVTNNLFSNVVLWYYGETTSRYNGSDGALSNVLAAYNTEDSDFFTNNIWALTHMYYKLFLYYHVLGHNTKFYPRLFEMLRQDPMSGGYNQNGATSLLHFYKKCCLASGDDLTEFFRAHGFFSVMDNRLVGDYSNSIYTTTQADIDAAIKEVKDLGYDENIAVLFINDATGETIKSHKGDNLELYGETTVCAEVGSYASFADNTTPDYTYSVSGSTVTMEGTGGTGFAIFNEKGEIIAFSDKKTFTISEECAVALASGKAEVKAVKADNTPVEAVDVMDTNDAEAKYMALGELLDAAKTVTNLADATGTKVGYYRSDLLTDLQDAYEKAKTVYDNETVASYNAVYDVLYQEYANVIADDFARIGIIEGNAYRLINKVYTGLSMSVNGNDKMLGENTVDANDAQKWYFEASNSRGRYYLKNKSTGKYPGDVYTSAVLDVNKTEDTKGQENGAYAYELRDMGNGYWALVGRTGLHCASSQSYNVVGWGTDADATLWNIIAVEVDQNAENLYKLQNLIEKTEVLMDEVGHIEREYVALTLTEDKYYTNAQCKNTSYGDQFTSYSVLCDNDPATYLHTDYSDKAPSEDHYIRIDVGSGDELKEFCLSYRTRKSGNLCAPTKMAIEVSNDADATTWVTLRDITSGLPTTGNTIYTAEDLGDGSAYRYVRVRVYFNSTDQQKNGHYYFIMSELGLSTANYVATLNEDYTSIASSTLLEAYYALQSAQEQITKENVAEYENAYNGLNSKYAALLSARNDAENATFQAKKTELQTWINKLNGFFGDNECGTVTPVDATSVTLSTTDSNDAYYLTGGPGAASEGSVDKLLEDNVTSYYVSNWNAQTEPPYLQVRLPEGKKLSEFTFTFTSRDGGKAPTPTEIVVSGSNDGTTFTPIETFTKENDGFPEAANTDNKNAGKAVTWNSPTITASTAYQYLRFTVTKSHRPTGGETDANGFYHYSISKFGLGTPSGYSITLGANPGGVTEELLLESYNVVAAASATLDMATTEEQLQKAIDKLQAQYNALEEAKNEAIDFTISSNIAGGGVRYKDVDYTTTLSAPSTPTTGELTAMEVDGYVAKSITINGTEISIMYNKVYTVKVTGGKGNGGITYGGRDYADGTTFDAEQGSFSVNDLTVIVPDGYTLKETITLNHETGVINVVFSAIPLVDTEKYYTFECLSSEAHKTERFIRDNGTVINGHSAEGSLFRFEAADDDNGYYIKSYVSDKYLNCTANENTGNDAVVESEQKSTVWKMAKHTEGVVTLTAGHDKYLNNNGDAPTYLLARYHNGGPASNNACSLWTLTEGTPLDKSALNTLIGETNTLIESCYTDEEFDYAGSLNVTEELMTATREAVTVAQEKYDSKATTESEYEAALNALQTAKDNLQMAINYANLPVQLTFDANSPVTYKIKINRTNTTVLAYDGEMVVVNDFKAGNKSQGWYFMAADNGKVYIMPYHDKNTTLALSTNDFNEGNSKVKGMPIGTDGYTQEWTISNTNMYDNNKKDGWYNITTVNGGTTWYFSNHGGVGNKMGFYNDPNDSGTLFKFEQADFSKSDPYYTLYNYFHNEVLATGSIEGSTAVGYLSAAVATPYNEAYNNAKEVLANTKATDIDYTSAYEVLKTANEALVPNMPEVGKFYRFVSADTKNDRVEGVVYANPADNKMYWSKEKETSDATAIWTIAPADNGTYHITNLHTGTSIGEFIGSNPSPLREEGGAVSIKPLSGDGQVGFISNGTMMHAQGDYSAIVHWETGAGDASAWRIVEVEDMSLMNFALKIGQYRHAGLYLNYATEIPEGVKVYMAHTPDGDEGSIIADELEGSILPARTAVIVQGNLGEYKFKYTTADYDGSEDLKQNLLGGSAYLKYQQVKDGYLCCVFGRLNDEVGLYKNWVQYTDASGSQIDPESKESVADTDRGTHFKVSANKIYYEYEPSSMAGASAFRFRFKSKEEETTTIDELLLLDDTIIYNLYGQRIAKVAEPGIYIVNGKKMYVTEKMIRDND